MVSSPCLLDSTKFQRKRESDLLSPCKRLKVSASDVFDDFTPDLHGNCGVASSSSWYLFSSFFF